MTDGSAGRGERFGRRSHEGETDTKQKYWSRDFSDLSTLFSTDVGSESLRVERKKGTGRENKSFSIAIRAIKQSIVLLMVIPFFLNFIYILAAFAYDSRPPLKS
jgi:hypothetical protein